MDGLGRIQGGAGGEECKALKAYKIPNLDASPFSLEMGECGTSRSWRPPGLRLQKPRPPPGGSEVEGRDTGLQEHLEDSPCFSPARRLEIFKAAV